MNRTQAIDRIQRTLGYRTDETETQQELVDALQDAQRQLEQGTTLPWFLLVDDAVLVTQNGVQVEEYPDGFLRMASPYEVEGKAFLDVLGRDEAGRRYAGSENGRPRVMSFGTNGIWLWPTPDGVYQFNFPYYKKAVELTSNVENEWLKHAPMVLIGAAGLLVAADRRNQTAAQKFEGMMVVGWEAIHRENAAREVGGRKIIMGGRN